MLSYYASSMGLGENVRPRPYHPAGGNILDDFIAEFDHWLVDLGPSGQSHSDTVTSPPKSCKGCVDGAGHNDTYVRDSGMRRNDWLSHTM